VPNARRVNFEIVNGSDYEKSRQSSVIVYVYDSEKMAPYYDLPSFVSMNTAGEWTPYNNSPMRQHANGMVGKNLRRLL
jgi:hypothetical protein